MKVSFALSKGLDEEETKRLVSEIEHSLLARQLKRVLRDEIEKSYKNEEQIENKGTDWYQKQVGERRGYRHVLRMILEE